MGVDTQLDLRISDRLDILYNLFRGEQISDLIDKLDNRAVSAFQKFMWEKTVEFGITCRGKNFDRKEVTRKMTPTPDFQRKQNCLKSVYYCKGTDCIYSTPKCARKKIKEHVDVMAQSIREYIRIVAQMDLL